MAPSRPSPTALMPAPHTTATPTGSPLSGSPARSSAKVSFPTVTVRAHPRAVISAARATSSAGRSALARYAETWSTGPTAPACASAEAISGSRTSTAGPAPTTGGWKPPPRAVPRTLPSVSTKATSVLLLPASMASAVPVRPT